MRRQRKRCVLILGLDGTRHDAFAKAATPRIDALGRVDLASTQLTAPTTSGPGWCSILTGLEADMHGCVDNDASMRGVKRGRGTLLRRAQLAGRTTGAVCEWQPLLTHVVESDALNVRVGGDGDAVELAAIAALRNRTADVLFVHFDEIDAAGHATGFDPSNRSYVAAIERVDARIGRVLDAIAAAEAEAAEAAVADAAAGPSASASLAMVLLDCETSRAYTPLWSCAARGEVEPLALWRPKLRAGQSFFGDHVTASQAYPFGAITTVAAAAAQHSELLAAADKFVLRWRFETETETDGDGAVAVAGAGGGAAVSSMYVWEPVPPRGFVAMGFLATTTPSAPSCESGGAAEHFRCVAQSAVRRATAAGDPAWQHWRSGSAHRVVPDPEVAQSALLQLLQLEAEAEAEAAEEEEEEEEEEEKDEPCAFWRSGVDGVARLGPAGSFAPPTACSWRLNAAFAADTAAAGGAAAGGAAAAAGEDEEDLVPREWLVAVVSDHGGEGLEHGARNAANRRIPQRLALGTWNTAVGAMKWRDAPRDDASPAPNRRRHPNHLDVRYEYTLN